MKFTQWFLSRRKARRIYCRCRFYISLSSPDKFLSVLLFQFHFIKGAQAHTFRVTYSIINMSQRENTAIPKKNHCWSFGVGIKLLEKRKVSTKSHWIWSIQFMLLEGITMVGEMGIGNAYLSISIHYLTCKTTKNISQKCHISQKNGRCSFRGLQQALDVPIDRKYLESESH